MLSSEITKNLKPEDLPNEELKLVAEICGMEFALVLIQNFSGITIGVPKNALKKVIDEYITNKYDGTRTSQLKLAIECGVTAQYVHLLSKRNRKGKVIEYPSGKKSENAG